MKSVRSTSMGHAGSYPEGIDRRQFLVGASLSLGFTLSLSTKGAAIRLASEKFAPVENPWDYVARPVTVTRPAATPAQLARMRSAFDGSGGERKPHAVASCWIEKPLEHKPVVCVIDYGEPVALSKLVHRFFTANARDFRPDALVLSSAFAALDIYRSEDGNTWELVENFSKLSADMPQVFTIGAPRPSRYYKLEIKELETGADAVRTYEIDSVIGPVIHDPGIWKTPYVGEAAAITGKVVGVSHPEQFRIALASVESSNLQANSAAVSPAGDFTIECTALQCGAIQVPLTLQDTQGRLIDQRHIVIDVLPRVVVEAVESKRGQIEGRLRNVSPTSRMVRIDCSGRSTPRIRFRAGQSRLVKLPDGVQRRGCYIVDLRVEEDGRGKSSWRWWMAGLEQISSGRLVDGALDLGWRLEGSRLGMIATPRGRGSAIAGDLDITIDGQPVFLSVSESSSKQVMFYGAHEAGVLRCVLKVQGPTVLVSFAYLATGLVVERSSKVLSVRLKRDNVHFRFMPGYVYSKVPVTTMRGIVPEACLPSGFDREQQLTTRQGGWILPTRLVALESCGGTIAMVPDRDRCLVGIDGDDALITLRVGAEPIEVRLPVIDGDWFHAFSSVVTEVFAFAEPRQYKPVTECIINQGRYLAGSKEIWSERLQVLRSFPNMDFVFLFYGLTYSIPALQAWYLMSGDEQARVRARRCVDWLLTFSDIRITQGPAAGAFFSQYLAPAEKPHPFGYQTYGGCDQAWNKWILSHTTGAMAWTLLHYYVSDEKRDAKVLAAAKAGLDWLLRIQNAQGGWAYAFSEDGTQLTDEEDSGNIWSIWALYRYGKLTGEKKYLEAADRGKTRFAERFVANHVARGYWEDVSGAKGNVQLSWEAYEFAIAANVFDEMGDAALAIQSARNAMTWVWTRVPEYAAYANSFGQVAEQWGWPPGAYIAPMFGLAAQTARRLSGDAFFEPFIGAAKTVGWWIVEETVEGMRPSFAAKSDIGAAFWPNDYTLFAPMEAKSGRYWVDWITSQQFTICLRWLIAEVNQRSMGSIRIDPDTLTGTVFGSSGRVRIRPGEIEFGEPLGEVNWLAYETLHTQVVALINHGERADIKLNFQGERANRPLRVFRPRGTDLHEDSRQGTNSTSVTVDRGSCAFVVRDA